jgi:hypothetical protein
MIEKMPCKKLDEMCVDIINTLGFPIKHPCKVKGKKILTKSQLDDYEEIVSRDHRDLDIYLISLIFEENSKEGPCKYPWKLRMNINTTEDLKALIHELMYIRDSVKLIKHVDDHVFIDFYLKYERYLTF